jgi:hypothetical protein
MDPPIRNTSLLILRTNCIESIKMQKFAHGSLELQSRRQIVFTGFSKKIFYLRFQISAFVLLNGGVPISPFMNFDYNLAGLVNKKHIRIANNTMIKKADELWVFGDISDGVLIEIFIARKNNKNVRFFIPDEKIENFKEIDITEVKLEDVSPWMWEWILKGRNLERWHPRLRLKKTYPLIYPAYSKRNFFLQMQISQYCLDKRAIPLNPFMLFRYFLGDIIPRENIYNANNNIVRICDEVWTFGEISNGVLAEIQMKKEMGGEVKYIEIIKGYPAQFRQINPEKAEFEKEEKEKLSRFRHILTQP